MKKIILILGLTNLISCVKPQKIDDIISIKEVERIETKLCSDNMMGRQVFTPSIEKAADFISDEMKQIGLKMLPGSSSYFQPFSYNRQKLANVVGILQGRSKKDEYVIFSAHYDHLGVEKSNTMKDSIYNGANDDASGVTAVLQLAKYYKTINNNERTLIFVAFTAEEVGGYGSQYFSKQLDPTKIAAMFNIEMIGTESKWGKNSAYITGYEKTDVGEILKRNLIGTAFKFYPDPYAGEDLFYRSDNATLAKLGVPAHTISTSKMDNEPHYHKVDDEIGTLNIKNMTEIIKSIAISAQSIVSSKDTPTRVKAEDLD